MAGAAIRFKNSLTNLHGTEISAEFKLFQKKMQAETREAAKDAAEILAGKMTYYIKTATGTISGPGRVKTGDMLGDVKVRSKGNSAWGSAEAGWIDMVKDYYVYQEEGFRHVRSGRYIPGMFAFGQAWIEATDYLTVRLKQIVG